MFRVLFGGVMLFSILRFAWNGWIEAQYIEPQFHFTYYGFAWVKALGESGMYLLYGIMALSALLVALGAFYRISSVLFFLSFTYSELIDKANYLNHYYFISLVAFLLIFLPAHRFFSLDVWRRPALKLTEVPRWTVGSIRLQLGLVYFLAGVAKLNPEWLFEAMPLRLWLPLHSDFPLIGWLFQFPKTAFAFAWGGALYDLLVPFFLLFKKTRPWAYLAVIGFHLMTWSLFQIGMFPWIMILSTLIFFPASFHLRVMRLVGFRNGIVKGNYPGNNPLPDSKKLFTAFAKPLLLAFFLLQMVLPFRYLAYPGELFWTEEGFRFSWRVMLMEKAGYATFYVKDRVSGGETEVSPGEYLTPNQEKMMATQPDMILEFAHFLQDEFSAKGLENPAVRAEVYVTLNGKGSRLFIDPNQDLTQVEDGFAHKTWILPYPYPETKLAFK
ncbi:MAG: HTTM domain-containing protein [Bacteroidia bacterium]|nr:HTTM domain-containing protein [Bacteroidia bacterium]